MGPRAGLAAMEKRKNLALPGIQYRTSIPIGTGLAGDDVIILRWILKKRIMNPKIKQELVKFLFSRVTHE
jgi:hypothetical protein